MQDRWDGKIESLAKTLSNVKASLRRKEMVLRNLNSLLEHEGLDKRPGSDQAKCAISNSRRLDL